MAPAALEALGRIADDGRADSGPPAPKWMLLIMSLVASEDETVFAVEELRETVVGQAKQAFGGTLEAKGLDDEERACVERYMAAETGRDGKPLSARERGEAERVFFDRFALAGTPEAVAERFLRAVDETGYTRAFIAVVSGDTDRVVRLAAERLLPRLLN
jgi:alkanesulfonate monooxygenase SsuD/methylene tetrahydromethanopterin reductase-like flavin-dependent oxidoreductase (luciferase family)